MSQMDLTEFDSQQDQSREEQLFRKCLAIASNLWWVWNPDVQRIFRDLDPIRWRQLDHNPVALLKEFTPARLAKRASELVLSSRINQAYRLQKEYMKADGTWASTEAGVLGGGPVAYFSAEFGIHESLPIYSGGLGVLSGDHVKSASGLGIPMVAIGLFYAQGYFRQYLDSEGYQGERYQETKLDELPIEEAKDQEGNPIKLTIETSSESIQVKVWQLQVGRVRLLLLDTNVDGNRQEDRALTNRLYGGAELTRIRQEMVLGIGGVKALRALSIQPGVYHLNEGHSAFGPLEVVRQTMEDTGQEFDDALRDVAQQTVFTTHTPVPAGHDRFSDELIREHLTPIAGQLGLSESQLFSLGKVDAENNEEQFCMTVLGLKMSRTANAVSQLHGHVSRRMWSHLWPSRIEQETPIGHITNGVHVHSWLAEQMAQLFDRHFGVDWLSRHGESKVWQNVYDIDPGELWETHCTLKNTLLEFTRRRLASQMRSRSEPDHEVEQARQVLDSNVLTIGFGRRFATYKRATLIFSDLDRIAAILNHPQRPVQMIFSGKAHPKDEPGKQFIKTIANLRHDPRFAGKVIFIEDYDVDVCRHMVQGVDVWLNNPRRPLEASGTSGQKVVLNGGLNFSVLDGWWAEAYDGTNGFAIGNGKSHVSNDALDQRDNESMLEVLENQVAPAFYDTDDDGMPRRWIRLMMNSIATLAWRFSSDRMVMDYTKHCYVPAAGGLSCKMH